MGGRNALDARGSRYMAVAHCVNTPPPGDKAHGVFVKGGTVENIVPRETVKQGKYVRRTAALDTLRGRNTACLAQAPRSGLECPFSSRKTLPRDIENRALLDAFYPNAALSEVSILRPRGCRDPCITELGNGASAPL
jgi:hypothetical protein